MMESLQTILESASEAAAPILFHSLWQGALIALLLKATLTLIGERKAQLRYLISGVALITIILIPTLTGIYVSRDTATPVQADPVTEQAALSAAQLVMESGHEALTAVTNTDAEATRWSFGSIGDYLIPLWLAGVFVLSFRHIVGWRRSRRLRCVGTSGVSPEWQKRFANLRAQLKVGRPVRLLRSSLVQVPCVVGWLKPVVLLPLATLANLKVSDIELIIAHELAHVRRHDILINVLQTVIETLLFFNPAVWWISHQIRIERERCCDDVAMAIAGDRLRYARALVSLEESRGAATGFVAAASGTGLIARVRRIVGTPRPRGHLSIAGATVTIVVAAMIAVGVTSFNGTRTSSAYAETTFEESNVYDPGRDDIRGEWQIETDNRYAQVNIRFERDWHTGFSVKTEELLREIDASTTYFAMRRDAGTFHFKGEFEWDGGDLIGEGDCYFRPNPDYVRQMISFGYDIDSDKTAFKLAVHDVTLGFVGGLRAYGYDDLTLDELIKAHIHDVTPEYIGDLEKLGYRDLSMDQLVKMQIHDVEPEYIEELSQLGYRDLSPELLVKMSIHDVETDNIRQFEELGYRGLEPSELIKLNIHDVDGDFVRGFAELGYDDLDSDELIQMSIHDVDPYLVKELAVLGYDDLKPSELVTMGIHDVTPAYIRGLADLGYRNLSPEELVKMSIHDVDARYVGELRDLGYPDLSSSQLVAMQIHDITPSFIRGFKELGYSGLEPDELIKLSIHDVSPRYIRELADLGYKDLTPETLVKMQIYDVSVSYIRRMHNRGLADLTTDELINLRIHGD